MPLNWLTETR